MPSSPYPRYHLLDPLRGVAIGCVLAVHLTGPGGAASAFRDFVSHAAQHGYLGVPLFFVISGYCISGAAARAGEAARPACQFLLHRIRRIFPPYWWSIALAVVLAAGTIFIGGRSWESIFPLDLRGWLLNIVLLQGPFAGGDIQLVYWSLTIEFQFYLVVGCLLLVPVRTEWLAACVAVVTGLMRSIPSLDLGGTFIEFWGQFSAGMACFYWLYNVRGSRRAAVLMLLATGLAAIVSGFTNPLPFGVVGSVPLPIVDGLAVALAVVLIAVHGADETLCRLPAVAVLGWAGTISYSLYLTHSLVGVRVMNVGMRLTGLNGLWWPVFFAAALAFSLAAGAVFFRFCEKPWMNFQSAPRPTR